MTRRSILLFSLLISLVLHLMALFFLGGIWEGEMEVEAFRARLAYRPRFEPPPRFPLPSMDLPRTKMEYLAPQRSSRQGEETEPASPDQPVVGEVAPPLLEISSQKVGLAKADAPLFAPESRPSPTEGGFADTLGIEAMELLRIEDMAQADGERAVVIPDPSSRRDVRGYVNFTYLRLDGTSNIGKVLDSLARYLRDYTGIQARVRDKVHRYFLSRQLLKDPIHFIFPGLRFGGGDTERATYLSEKEIDLLGEYLRGGGFLYVEGSGQEPQEVLEESGAEASGAESEPEVSGAGSEPGPRRGFLREMIVYVHDALYPDGRLFEIPPSHPIYHSFYDFDVGFPGEHKTSVLDVPVPAWYFRKGEKDSPGLWGVELDGDLVAVFSDLGLSGRWSGDGDALPGLTAATNIVLYALTRSAGLTSKRAQPAWKQARPESLPELLFAETDIERIDHSELFAVLGASLALVQAPFGSRLEKGDLRLRIDGDYAPGLLKNNLHGLLVHNLSAGRHWIEVEYGGASRQLEVDLRGGEVLTATFSLSRLVFFKQLRLQPQEERIPVEDWLGRFSDLEIKEMYWREE